MTIKVKVIWANYISMVCFCFFFFNDKARKQVKTLKCRARIVL